MEVHHPHHPTHKKKWSEYIIEFVMLFTAVTLGFFAENIREHQVEKQREISYLKNVHEDLKLDFETIATVSAANNSRLLLLDSLFLVINNNKVTDEDYYYYIRNLALRATFEGARTGFDQIKSSGGLRMVKNQQITSGIQQYEIVINSTTKLEQLREATIEEARFKMAEVLDAKVLYEMSNNQIQGNINSIIRFKRPTHVPAFSTSKKDAINDLLNLVAIGLNTNRYLNLRLKELETIGKKLDDAILAEYKEDIK